MDFIERIFHLAPDGGTGALESAIVLALLVVALAAVVLRSAKEARGGSDPLE